MQADKPNRENLANVAHFVLPRTILLFEQPADMNLEYVY